MSDRLQGKVAVITGAGSGIGSEIARRFAAQGARVALGDIDVAAVEAVARDCGGVALARELDVTDADSVASFFGTVVDRFGGVDVVANNAGVLVVGGVDEVGEETWDRGFDVNVKGVFLMMRAAWPLMAQRGGGSIINMGSAAGLEGVARNLGYCATKAAVVLMTRSAALDGASLGIRVNCVCPGFVDAGMTEGFFAEQEDPAAARAAAEAAHPLGRLGTAKDIADAYVYLASDEASWVTGVALKVDGGLTAGL
jgi:NAD(P)-dependent dehydrogenase (short-subunit alcohol dehydrogenase family)